MHLFEDSIGPPSAGFRGNKAGLPRDFHTRRYALFHCFRPGFSARGSRRGSKRAPRFLFAAGKMPSYNKVALSYNKATFLTEHAELGKMRSGAARTAGGWSHLREEVVDMPITITLHIFGYTVTIRIKGENRHSGVAAHKTGFEKQILWQLLDKGC